MLRNGRYEAWITSDEALFHLSFTTGKMKIPYISGKKTLQRRSCFEKCKLAVRCYGNRDLYKNVGASRFNALYGQQGCILTRTVESNQVDRLDGNPNAALLADFFGRHVRPTYLKRIYEFQCTVPRVSNFSVWRLHSCKLIC
ncbi:hypothetical protein TNCV_1114891 [Trichonephila clavipes]|nr:hypothetical protein TNCV_1114891 [Trichonephila clavipes]